MSSPDTHHDAPPADHKTSDEKTKAPESPVPKPGDVVGQPSPSAPSSTVVKLDPPAPPSPMPKVVTMESAPPSPVEKQPAAKAIEVIPPKSTVDEHAAPTTTVPEPVKPVMIISEQPKTVEPSKLAAAKPEAVVIMDKTEKQPKDTPTVDSVKSTEPVKVVEVSPTSPSVPDSSKIAPAMSTAAPLAAAAVIATNTSGKDSKASAEPPKIVAIMKEPTRRLSTSRQRRATMHEIVEGSTQKQAGPIVLEVKSVTPVTTAKEVDKPVLSTAQSTASVATVVNPGAAEKVTVVPQNEVQMVRVIRSSRSLFGFREYIRSKFTRDDEVTAIMVQDSRRLEESGQKGHFYRLRSLMFRPWRIKAARVKVMRSSHAGQPVTKS